MPTVIVVESGSSSSTDKWRSRTSWADSYQALGDERGEEFLDGALAGEVERGGRRAPPVHDLEVLAAAELAALLAQQDHDVARAAEGGGRAVGVLEQPDDADDRRRDRWRARRSRCTGRRCRR